MRYRADSVLAMEQEYAMEGTRDVGRTINPRQVIVVLSHYYA
jgi:hypothetical protein